MDASPSAPSPLEPPTGRRAVRPSTAWILGLFIATALGSILRHLL